MIIINTCHIPPCEILTVDGTEKAEILNLEECQWEIRATGDIAYQLYASMAGGDLVVRGKVMVPVITTCARCAEEFAYTLAVKDLCILREKCAEQEVDITGEVREELLLAFPMRFLCDEDCKGICSGCRTNLNQGKCKCKAAKKEEAFIPEQSPWDVLDQLQTGNSAPAPKKGRKKSQ